MVILISHRLTELAAHSDRVAIILDGRCVEVLEGASCRAETIAESLVRGLGTGSQTKSAASAAESSTAEQGLELTGIVDRKGAFESLDFGLPRGAVTALIGVEGSGGREIIRACAGLRSVQGRASVRGRAIRPNQLHHHVSYVAADRASSLFRNLSVGENLVIRLDHEISRGILGLRRRRMRSIAEELRTSFQVKAAGIDIGIGSLSGGNQQKVAIAAAVGSSPRPRLGRTNSRSRHLEQGRDLRDPPALCGRRRSRRPVLHGDTGGLRGGRPAACRVRRSALGRARCGRVLRYGGSRKSRREPRDTLFVPRGGPGS